MHRCEWACGSDLELEYHDREWGVPTYDERRLFEFLILRCREIGKIGLVVRDLLHLFHDLSTALTAEAVQGFRQLFLGLQKGFDVGVALGDAGGGGYSLFNLGLDFSKRWKYFDLSIGTPNFIGLILPNHYTGTGLYLRLATSLIAKPN